MDFPNAVNAELFFSFWPECKAKRALPDDRCSELSATGLALSGEQTTTKFN
jgi:hypothetical protein